MTWIPKHYLFNLQTKLSAKIVNSMSTILEIANADRNFHLLVQGLKDSNLEEKLKGFGPFTLLAPVNLAFRSLVFPDNIDGLLSPTGNKSRLADILGYHIITSKKLLKDFRDGQKLQTSSGKEVTVSIKDNQVSINGAKILARDMQGSNGVIHSINSVNLPEK